MRQGKGDADHGGDPGPQGAGGGCKCFWSLPHFMGVVEIVRELVNLIEQVQLTSELGEAAKKAIRVLQVS